MWLSVCLFDGSAKKQALNVWFENLSVFASKPNLRGNGHPVQNVKCIYSHSHEWLKSCTPNRDKFSLTYGTASSYVLWRTLMTSALFITISWKRLRTSFLLLSFWPAGQQPSGSPQRILKLFPFPPIVLKYIIDFHPARDLTVRFYGQFYVLKVKYTRKSVRFPIFSVS